MPKDRRKYILDEIADAVSRFLYYDRKEDEELGTEDIGEALREGEITFEEIVEAFENNLAEGLGYSYDEDDDEDGEE